MGPIDFLLHLLGLLAPAAGVALGVALAARLVLPRRSPPQAWWMPLAINFAAGSAVTVAGLWYFGRDGKMATYAALVVAVATAQWLSGRAWRP
jgi:hypothetical protein